MTNNLPAITETPQTANTAPKGLEVEDIIAYRKKGLSEYEIATLLHCSQQTVNYHLQRADIEGLETFSEHKDKILEHKQREIVKSLSNAKVKGMSGLQLITGAAILEDKIRAIRGQATEIIDHRHLVVDLGKAIEAMRAEQADTVDISVYNTSCQPHCPQVKT